MPGTSGGSQGPQQPGKSTSSHSSSKGKSHPSSKGTPKSTTNAHSPRSTTEKPRGRKEVQSPVEKTASAALSNSAIIQDVSRKEHRIQFDESQSVQKPQTSTNQHRTPHDGAKKEPKVQKDARKELRIQIDEPQAGNSKSPIAGGASSPGTGGTAKSRFDLPGIISRNFLGKSRKSSGTSTPSSRTSGTRTTSRRPPGTNKKRDPKKRSRSRSTSPSSSKKSSSPGKSSSKSSSASHSESPSPKKSRPRPQIADESEKHPRVSFGYAVAFQEFSTAEVGVEILPVEDSTSKDEQLVSLPTEIPEPPVEPKNDGLPVHGILHNKEEKPLCKPPSPEMLDNPATSSRRLKKSLKVVLYEQCCSPRIITYILGAIIILIVVTVITVLVKLLQIV